MLRKSVIQFSVDGQGCVPARLFTWGQTMVEVMKMMATSLQRSHARTAALSAPDPAAGQCQPRPLLETPAHSRASLGQSCGVTAPFSWVLVHKFLFVSSESLFPSPV